MVGISVLAASQSHLLHSARPFPHQIHSLAMFDSSKRLPSRGQRVLQDRAQPVQAWLESPTRVVDDAAGVIAGFVRFLRCSTSVRRRPCSCTGHAPCLQLSPCTFAQWELRACVWHSAVMIQESDAGTSVRGLRQMISALDPGAKYDPQAISLNRAKQLMMQAAT